jgi:predicted metal-dependent peptidase
MKRFPGHNGTITNQVHVGDVLIDKHQKVEKGKKPKGWIVVGDTRAADSSLVEVDTMPMRFEEHELENGGGGSGNMPDDFDSHQWDSSAEESEMMDATEDLVKRAMQKRGLTYDKLPGFIQELLQDIEARRSELNYRQLILSAIKKHASGFNREHSWTKPSRRFGNKAPGTRNGKLPHLGGFIDSSGSISIQEANDFLSIIDEFLKVGSRNCDLGLWHTNVYHFDKYKLGNRLDQKTWQSGGTDVGPTLKKIYEEQPDLAIILTDGCYCDVDFEQWLKPGEHFPQVLWIISREGSEEHPLKRLGETIKIPNTDVIGRDKKLEQQ